MRARFPYNTSRELIERPPTRSLHPVHVYHERIEDYHMAIASRANDAVTAQRAPSDHDEPEKESPHLQSALDRIATDLTGAMRELEQLLDSMSPELRRKNVHAIAMLARAHDDCCQELAEAGDALRTGAGVHVRIRLARLFSAIGRAEQAHHYLRSARLPAT